MSETRTPDAIQIPVGYQLPPGTRGRRFDALLDLAEEILVADPTRGQKAYRGLWAVNNAHHFCLDPGFTFKFPTGHYLEGKPRFHWVEQKDRQGMIFGYLTDEARVEMEAAKNDA